MPFSPFQRHVYVFLVSLTCIVTIVTIRNSTGNNRTRIPENSLSRKNDEEMANVSELKKTALYRVVSENYRRYENYMPDIKVRSAQSENKLRCIYFLGLFELSTEFGLRQESLSETSAAQLAIKHVNDRQVLPGYVLKLLINNTNCDPGVGIDSFFHALYSNKTIIMLLGSGCSNVTESLANIVPYWNILQVSYGSVSPSLSERSKFPLFFRTATPDSSHNPARLAFIRRFNWNTVATFSQSENTFLLPLNNLVTILENANVTCSAAITFSLDNYKEQLRALKVLDTRIIVGSFSAKLASKIFCEIFELEMYGADYVWLLHEPQFFWRKNSRDCDEDILRKVVEGVIIVSEHNVVENNATSVSGLKNERFEQELNTTTISKYTKHTYDAVWAMALALRKVQDLHFGFFLSEFTYKREDMVKNFAYAMSSLNFMGISGPVKFSGADRIGNSAFKQMQDNKLETIAVFYANENFLDFNCRSCHEIRWQGGRVPIAQRVFKIRLVTIPKLAFYSVLCISSMGISVCLLFLYFSLHFRRIKTLKLSSPRLNNIAALGCILVYTAVILLGVDKAKLLREEYFSQLCTMRIYLLSAGFSLAFGSMFAKTYRVHRIFTYSCTSLVKDKILKDKQLIAAISFLLVIDAVIVTNWVFLDPLQRQLQNLTTEINSEDRGVVYQPQVEICGCNNTRGWFLAIYGYKGFLLIMGLYMAWETRKVQIQALNDSQYIGICVYSAVSSAAVVILSNYLSENTIINYLATTSSILVSTTITLFLLFLPKLRAILGHITNDDPVMESMGLKLESNTRRLMTIDPNELTYRMEVQNKVYRCELDALDREIARLEALLTESAPTSPTSCRMPFTVSNLPVVLLSVPSNNLSRASWPACENHDLVNSSGSFRSENKLYKETNENFFEKMKLLDRLKEFFGSIPSVWFSLPQDGNVDDVVKGAKKRKPNSNPEFCTQSLVCDRNFLRTKSAISVISRTEVNVYSEAELFVNISEDRINVY